jgi:hypothetical protein
VVVGPVQRVPFPGLAYHPLDTARSAALEPDQVRGWQDLELLQLPCGFTDNDEQTVVLREHTRLVVAEALNHLAAVPPPGKSRGAAVLVTGSPGIGKSYSFIPALVRGLAQGLGGPVPPAIIIEDRAVLTVFKLRLNGHGAVTSADRIDLEDFRAASDPDLQLNTTVYIVDPTSTNGTAGSPGNVVARTVVVSSPNSSHFKEFRKREPPPHVLYMEPWSLYELLAARVHINDSVSPEIVVERWMAQGGNPRNVLRTLGVFTDAQRRTEYKIDTLPEHVLKILLGAPETIRLEEGDETAPNSAVVAYTSKHPFTKPCGVFISNSVLRAVACQFYGRVFRWIDDAGAGDRRGAAADAFQAIACKLLAGNCEFHVVALDVGELMLPPVRSLHTHTHPPTLQFGYCKADAISAVEPLMSMDSVDSRHNPYALACFRARRLGRSSCDAGGWCPEMLCLQAGRARQTFR